MLTRAKKIAAVILAETTTPAAVRFLSHNLRGALSDLAAELREVNQRLDLLERDAPPSLTAAEWLGKLKGGDDGKN